MARPLLPSGDQGIIPDFLEAEGECVGIADVDENAQCQNVAPNKTLDVLPLEGCPDRNCFDVDIVLEEQTHQVAIAVDARRRRCVYRRHTDGV